VLFRSNIIRWEAGEKDRRWKQERCAMGYFSIDGRIYAEVKMTGLQGQPGLGFHRLLVHLDLIFMPLPEGEGAELQDLSGELMVEGRYLCQLRPMQEAPRVPVGKYSGSYPLVMVADLSLQQLEAIEGIRLGKGLTIGAKLSMTWSGRVQNRIGLIRLPSDHLSHQVNQGTWAEILQQMGYRRVMLLEIPVPDERSSPELAEATAHLAKAQQALDRGEYREAVGCCRDVLESLSVALGDSDNQDPEVQSLFKNIRSMDKEARLRVLRRALKLLCHPARHADEVSAKIDWYRNDATSAITMIAALLRLLGNRYLKP